VKDVDVPPSLKSPRIGGARGLIENISPISGNRES